MNKKTRNFAAAIAALAFAAGAVSCGRDVPAAEEKPFVSPSVVTSPASTDPADSQPTVTSPGSTDPDTTDATGGYVAEGGEGTTAPGGHTVGDPKPTGITLSYNSTDVWVGQTVQYPQVAETIEEVWTSSDESVATVDKAGNITGKGEGTCIIRVTSADDPKLGAEVKVTVKKPEEHQVTDGITYIQGIMIANKSYALPASYNPGGLTGETYSAFQELVQGAASDGLNIYNSSGFRSYEYQSQIYNNYVAIYGQATADTFSARPGYSEHQTGMAIDCNIISDDFIGTPEAIWLEAHCTEYGFIIRYPKGKQSTTGYKYEPWHIRFIGKDNAAAFKAAMDSSGDPYLTLEEYLGIDSYYH